MVATKHVDRYSEWTQNRTVTSFGTNDGAPRLAYQSWHHFKEAFPPEFIKHAMDNSNVRVSRCIDPFGGSGTTALTSLMLGIECTTVEVNPFLADVIRTKLSNYDIDRLTATLHGIRRKAKRLRPDPRELFGFTPPTFIEPGKKDRWIFDAAVAQRIAAIMTAIDLLAFNDDDRRLFRVILGGILCQSSNARISGKGRRYRQNWRLHPVDPSQVDAAFAINAETAILDIYRHRVTKPVRQIVIQGDARNVQYEGEYEIAIMSPPYPNSFDYTDVYNIELWMLGYLSDFDANRDLRTSTLTSHVQLRRDYAPPPSGSRLLDVTLKRLTSQQDSLWNNSIPAMVGAYFTDLLQVLDRVHTHLSVDGQCWMVVGDSCYADRTVEVAKILKQLVQQRGWKVIKSVPFRHMKSSAQQGWRPKLAESLLVMTPQS